MEGSELKTLFEQSQLDPSKNLELTRDEAEKFRNAFDDPEFCKLMAEYVSELQDPTNRAETETYISQLEGENKVPEGKELIRPQSSFVAKTKKVENGTEEKVFINIVSSDKIAAPTKSHTPKGQNWSLPYSLGPPHMEKDKGGEAVAAFDCCFHPEAIARSQQHKQFRDILVQTAISGIEEAFNRQHKKVSILMEFRVLKGVSYKSGQVPTMLIDIAGKSKWKGNELSSPADGENTPTLSASTSPMDDKAEPSKSASKSSHQSVPAIKKGFLNTTPESAPSTISLTAHKQKLSNSAGQLQDGFANKSSRQDTCPGFGEGIVPLETRRTKVAEGQTGDEASAKVPHYTIVERAMVGMGDFGDKSSNLSTRPAELVCKIDIPKVLKVSDVELIVGEREIKLNYLDIYDLTIPLPYPVFDKKGKAKHEKTRKVLILTLPVKPNTTEIEKRSGVPAVEQCEEDADTMPTSSQRSDEAVYTSKRSPEKNSHDRWIANSDARDIAMQESKRLKEEVEARVRAAKESTTCRDIASPLEGCGQDEILKSSFTQDDCHATMQFLPALCFLGRKEGYVFKRGEQGLGYYPDMYAAENRSVVPAAFEGCNAQDMPDNVVSKEFMFDFRQTEEAIAVIIQVENIVESSVAITFVRNGVDVKFWAGRGVEDVIDNSSSSRDLYAMGFDCSGDIEVKSCTFNVATQNMVIILHKCEAGFWGGGDECARVLRPRTYTNPSQIPCESPSASTGIDAVAPTLTGVFGLKSMQFCADGLLDLD